jgi:hypothetical protein
VTAAGGASILAGRHALRSLALCALLAGSSVPRAEDGLPPQPGAPPAPREEDELGLGALLDRLGRVAGLYHDTGLKFACDEEITGTDSAAPNRFEYIYVYSASQGLRDYRTLPGRRREVDPGAYPTIPQFLRRAYSWVFVFAPSARKHHRYAMAGEDETLGRAALKITFEPIPPIRTDVNEWFGTAWVDRETFQILRVEARRREDHFKQEGLEQDLATAPAGHAIARRRRRTIEGVTTEFSFEKNGMRFPGKVVIARTAFTVPGEAAPFDESPVYRVEQRYTNYRFYSVRTLDEIRAIVSGPLPTAPPGDTEPP